VAPTLVNSIGMKFVLIPAGTFLMGSRHADEFTQEDPQHEVELTRPFFLGECPVTQETYECVIGKNPSYFSTTGDGQIWVWDLDTKSFPVETVSWTDAMAFCTALSKKPEEKAAGRNYRLPTEAEWERACRGGATFWSLFHFGDSLSSIQANFHGTLPFGTVVNGPNLRRPCPVCSYSPNAFGLFDMHGNVYEWCLDWYESHSFRSSKIRDPQGPETGQTRINRGGSWEESAFYCNSANRNCAHPDSRDSSVGFRVCCFLQL
jgi:formylglycine-generating enzyme required for sulfatase activity